MVSTLTSMHGRDCIIKNRTYVDSYAMKAIFVTANEHKHREVQEILQMRHFCSLYFVDHMPILQ
jgi:hypothetical protein